MTSTSHLRAVSCDGLVLGLGNTDSEAISDARENEPGPLDENDLDYDWITTQAADYVLMGGDCRGLSYNIRPGDPEGERLIDLTDKKQ